MKAKTLILAIATLFVIGCSKQDKPQPELTPLAVNFSFGSTEANEGTAFEFKNESSGASTYSWDFGNGKLSSEKEPNITYAMHGIYVITLTVTSATGNTEKMSKELIVNCIFRNPNSPTNPVHPPLF